MQKNGTQSTKTPTIETQNSETQNTMAKAEENPFHGIHNNEGEEITEEDIQNVEQHPNFHKCLEIFFERNGEKYLLMLAKQGVKLLDDFDVNQLKAPPKKRKKETKQVVSLTHQMKNLQQQILDMQRGTSKRYLIQEICPYPFDQDIHIIPFPKHCEFPKYEKYNRKTDPIDHAREFRTMSLEFARGNILDEIIPT